MADWKIPFGNARGELLTATDVANITWAMGKVAEKLAENPDKPYADKDRQWLTAAQAELERRDKGGGTAIAPRRPPAANGQAIERPAPAAGLELSASDAAAVTQWFAANKSRFNLVTPSTIVQSLPEGCEVAVSMITINPDTNAGEVFKTDSGKLALTGMSLAKVSAAAGISWDPAQCHRVDDRSDPRYVEYQAVGGWRLFDGTFVTESAHRAVDLRDGSDEIEKMTDKQLAQQRKFILPLAETKAKNRVIRRLGIKSGYTAEELKTPFAVARLMWTGRTEDPELRRTFAVMKAEQMNASGAALFGPPQAPRQYAAPGARVSPSLGAPQAPAPSALPSGGYDLEAQGEERHTPVPSEYGGDGDDDRMPY